MNTFFINSALNVNQLSVFDNPTRFNHMVGTLISINDYFPGNNKKYIFDSSPEAPDMGMVRDLEKLGADFLYFGADPRVRECSLAGYRSLAETLSFQMFLNQVKFRVDKGIIYKLSGRYQLNEKINQIRAGSYHMNNAFVFSKPLDSWMHAHAQERAGVSKLYRLRLWYMDASLLEFFAQQLPLIYENCLNYSIDIEHAYYKFLNPVSSKQKVIEVDTIGVQGYIAPNGEYITE